MPDHERYRLVLVDDVPEIREILRFLLEDTGRFTIVGQAGGAQEAIDLVERESPDLALVDLELAGPLSGWDVLAAIAERSPSTRVVILSGSVGEVPAPAAERRALAGAVVQKGVTTRELAETLLDVLGGREHGATRDDGSAGPALRPAPDPNADAWLAAIVNSSPDAVIGQTLDGTIVSWNHAAERLYGYSSEQAVSANITMLVPPDRLDELHRIWARLGTGRVVQDLETRRIRRDGTTVDVVLTISPVASPDGPVIGGAVVARDLSGRRDVETTLSRAVAQLERKNRELLRSNEELDHFAAVASHDLAQPLQVAYGFVDMVRSRYGARLDDDGREWLDHALRGLERLRALVRDILEYSRAGSGEPSREPVELDGIVAAALSDLRLAIEERGATVDVGPLGVVLGDESQLRLVFQNLVSNALKFVPEGTPPRVSVTASAAGEDVVVDVVDNGIGVPADQRAHIFEMFQRAAGSEVEGSGVGLTIVKKIVRRHGGSVWVESGQKGVGARVRVRLPGQRGTRREI